MSELAAESMILKRGSRTIPNGISTRADVGVFLAIVGPNGSGKSSLARALAGIWPMSEGSVRIDARPLSQLSRCELARPIALAPQDTRMDFAFTVEEVVAMGRHPPGSFERATAADRKAIVEALARCDITHLGWRFVTTLSGEKQRVAIARSLAVEPEIILLDEPTASLDVQHSLEILDPCHALVESGKSVVLAMHDLNAVARYAAQVALIESGKLAYMGDRDGVLTANVLDRAFRVTAEWLHRANGQSVYVFHRREPVH